MHRARYVQDTSASQRARAIYLTACDEGSNNGPIHDVGNRRGDVTKSTQSRKWDEESVDSGFSSDIDRRVTQLNISGAGDVIPDDIKFDVVRAPSRAKLTEKERRLKYRTLPNPGSMCKWHGCGDVTEASSTDDVESSSKISQTQVSRSNSLPSEHERAESAITWDDVRCSQLRVLGILGGGGYAKVFLVEVKRNPGPKFALKVLNKQRLVRDSHVQRVVSEKEALRKARSRFIPQLFRSFQSANHLYIITEACMGGDLFSILEKHGALPHSVTGYVMACVTEGLDHLHRVLGFVHRDIKTENILIGSDGVVKIADLGFSKQLRHNDDVTYSFCGTAGYVAPEMLTREGHGRTCDFFSMGVVMFETATCRSPFRRHCTLETHEAVLRGIKEVVFPPNVRSDAVHMITSLCERYPQKRLGYLGCEEVRRHKFFHRFDWNGLRQGHMTSPLMMYVLRIHRIESQKERKDLRHSSQKTESGSSRNLGSHETTVSTARPKLDQNWSKNF